MGLVDPKEELLASGCADEARPSSLPLGEFSLV